MGNDWSSESMQRENSVVISTSKLRSERGKRGKIEREREGGNMELEKWSEKEEWDKLSRNIRETRVFSPLFRRVDWLPMEKSYSSPNWWESDPGNVEKASHLVLNLDQLSINGCEIIIRDSSFSGAGCASKGKKYRWSIRYSSR